MTSFDFSKLGPLPLKLIVAGGRDFKDMALMKTCLTQLDLPEDTELVCGMARGADLLAYVLWNQIGNPTHAFPADWNAYGRSAGFRRNAQMSNFADQLVAFWNAESRGTEHMIQCMQIRKKPLIVFDYQGVRYDDKDLP